MMKTIWLILILMHFFASHLTAAEEYANRPNIVWIISDDLGPELGCYGYPDVATPNIDRLAQSGRRYTHAFATAPVCSASRTAFQTGRYQTSIGGHHHNTRDKRVLPDSVPTVTGLMRQAGYFVSNGRGTIENKKTAKSHLNFVYNPKTFFDGYDWSLRKEGQPFFAQVQISEPHRTFDKANRIRTKAPIPPYYPEHPVTRADWSSYLTTIEELDRKVGAVLDRLKDEGELDNTLIFFFGDHGRPHVRGKQWLYDGGIHTPLIVSWPGRVKPGDVEKRFASLLDAMPTTLAAADVDMPDSAPKLPGLNLLAEDWNGHEMIFAARDRCGDAVDRIRCVRTRDFKYIRNFRPDLPYLQHSGYKKLSYPVETLMRVRHDQGHLNTLFMQKTRPKEELYDLNADPHEMNNVAEDPAYAKALVELRGAVDQWIAESGDLGAVDESKTVDIDALMKEKRQWYEKTMKKRGLDPDLSDRAYLKWWKKELGVNDAK